MSAPREILELVARFEQQLDAYKSGQYNETQVRREFLDPFFKALGWDIDNVQGFAEAYKDVIHEDQIRIAGATKAPDYCFRIGGTRKYFLEAKKPSVFIKEEIPPAYQLRRYAWSAKLPLSILSDFEELAVYDCRVKPHKDDAASTARIFYCTFRDYAEKWDWIYERFSRDAVLKGSFDKFAESTKTKRGTTEVDAAFLAEIENWRSELAKNLALRNPKLSQRELNFAVQRIIDRIIFLRICEDRGIEDYARLRALVNGDRIYPRLAKLFEQADDRYNSGLFHFKKETGRHEAPDELTLDLDIDDKLLRDILRGLYYPDSPYEFSVLSADILGQVYEQFLGKVIRLTEGHRAVVDDKPEVKKAGGVYYTPTYIVDYIVRQTVGKLVEECSSRRKEALTEKPGNEVSLLTSAATEKVDARTATGILNRVSKLRILDPACGSGSFLIGAYQFLLDWHLQFYLANDPAKWARETRGRHPVVVQGRRGGWQLSIAERKRILLANIHGVDIDTQAVEVTKLSLLLKVLEGEAGQAQIYFALKDRVLPDLGDNIKCGNSLIGPDFYRQAELPLLTDDEKYRINVFDWQAEFPEIFRSSRREEAQTDLAGKDRASSRRLLQGDEKGGFDAVIGNPPYRMLQPHNTEQPVLNYLRENYVAAEFKIELFHLFLQRGVSLLKEGGFHGHIVPTTILNNVYAEKLREWLMDKCCIENISVARGQVFPTADVHTSVLTFRRESDRRKKSKHEVLTSSNLSEKFTKQPGGFSRIQQRRFEKLPGRVWNILLNESYADLITRLTGEFSELKAVATINRGLITGDRDKYFANQKKSKSHVSIIAGGDVQRYFTVPPSEFVLFERPDTAGGCWDKEVHLAPHKVVVRQIGFKPTASILIEPIAVTGNIFTVRAENLPQELYLLGIINSRLVDFFWRTMFADFKSSFPQVTIFSLSQVPVRVINFSDKSEKALHDRMVKLVEQMLGLHERFAAARTPQEQTALERQIAATDAQIDRLVYSLYGLTEDEIKIVEGTVSTEAQSHAGSAEVPAKPKRRRKAKSLYAQKPPPLPQGKSTAESEALAAHFYFMAKEEPPSDRTNSTEPESEGKP